MNVKKLKQANIGITLIALVVTIVILLILAGITINLVFSDNGIIKKSFEDFGISFSNYSRTSNKLHAKVSSEFFKTLYDKKMLAAVISAMRRMSEIVIFKYLCCFMVITFLRETLFQYFTTIKAVVHLL